MRKTRIDIRVEEEIKSLMLKYEDSITNLIIKAIIEYLNKHYKLTKEEKIILDFLKKDYIKETP